jgi:chromosome segregation ATPase
MAKPDPQPESDPPPEAKPGGEEARRRRPTLWIVLTVLFALAAVGLGIWAFSLNSDLDDAEATVEKQDDQIAAQKEQLAAQEEELAQAEEPGGDLIAGAKQAYEEVGSELQVSEQESAAVEQELENAASQLEQAEAEVAEAKSEADKAKATLKEAEASAETAKACAQSAIAAFGSIFEAASVQEGIEGAVAQLETLEPACGSVLRAGGT